MEGSPAENIQGSVDGAVAEKGTYIPGFGSVEDFVQDGFKCFINTTKSSNRLPFGKGRDIYESYPVFHRIMKHSADNVLAQLSKLLKTTGFRRNILNRDDEEKFEMIVDFNDGLLGKVGKNLDQISGIFKYTVPKSLVNVQEPVVSSSWNINPNHKNYTTVQFLNEIFESTRYMEKPQLYFKDKIDNARDSPFVPKIKYKHNLLKPLAITERIDDSGNIYYSHPYEFELKHFQPSETQLAPSGAKMYLDFRKTNFCFVNRVEDVKYIIESCRKCTEIAVDLEHHSYRSFQGFTCLLQISTRDSDYIIDTLALRNELEELNEIFTDPKIVKVFHGADCDLLWLQRDFGLYVVNLFDTFEAAKVLNYPRHSLLFLLQMFCNVTPPKHFQLADWRIRPLPEALIKYARMDTHYLLYIYDKLKSNLLEMGNGKSNYLEAVIATCTSKCLKQLYEKPVWNGDNYLPFYMKSRKLFDNRQIYALKSLYEWRDNMAREQDESPGYVLPFHMMLIISEILPREAQGIIACCNPVPVLVRKNLLNLHQIILKAREQPVFEPVFEEREFHRPAEEDNLAPKHQMNCPHDLNHEPEFRDDLPVVISNGIKIDLDETMVNPTPAISVFDKSVEQQDRNLPVVDSNVPLTPYQRYKLTKPFNEKNEAGGRDGQNLVASDQGKTEKEVKDEGSTVEINPENKFEKPMSLKKRKAEEAEGTPSKKCKKEEKESGGSTGKCDCPEGSSKQERLERKGKEKHPGKIEPFDYSSIDFNKFQTYGAQKRRENQKSTSLPSLRRRKKENS